MTVTHRRICWPDPDSVCLEGGCGYCNDNPMRTVEEIRDYAYDHGLTAHYVYGAERQFNNAETQNA